MSSFSLKVLAVITMAIDHVGAVLFPDLLFLRIIGRLAFPIFAFLLVEGFFHTRDRKKYAIRLFIFALISEIPFDLAIGERLFEFTHQNVIMTFFIAFIMMILLEKYKKWYHRVPVGIIGMLVAYLLKVDYTFIGILVVFIFYILRNKKREKIIAQIAVFIATLNLEMFAALSMISIGFYNGERGRFKMKYFFYFFYPAHLLLLFFISNILQRGKLI